MMYPTTPAIACRVASVTRSTLSGPTGGITAWLGGIAVDGIHVPGAPKRTNHGGLSEVMT